MIGTPINRYLTPSCNLPETKFGEDRRAQPRRGVGDVVSEINFTLAII